MKEVKYRTFMSVRSVCYSGLSNVLTNTLQVKYANFCINEIPIYMQVVIFLTAAVSSPVSILPRVSVVYVTYTAVHNVTHLQGCNYSCCKL